MTMKAAERRKRFCCTSTVDPTLYTTTMVCACAMKKPRVSLNYFLPTSGCIPEVLNEHGGNDQIRDVDESEVGACHHTSFNFDLICLRHSLS